MTDDDVVRTPEQPAPEPGTAAGTAAASGTGAPRRVTGYAFLFTLVLGTGFWNVASESWSPFFRLNLLLHPLLGLLVTFTIVLSLFERLRVAVPALGFAHVVSLASMGFVALVRVITLVHLPEMQSNGLTWFLTPLLLVCTAFFVATTVPLLPAVSRTPNAWSQIALVTVWLLSAAIGVLIAANAVVRRVPSWLVVFHAGLGYVAAAAGIWMLVVPALRRLRSSGLLFGTVGALALLFGTAFVVDRVVTHVQELPRLPELTFHLSVVPEAARPAADRDPHPQPVDASWLAPTESCGGEDCHGALVQEHRTSLHATAYDTPHLHRVLGGLRDELGAGAERICAGCHIPGSLLEGGPPPEAFRSTSDLSCVFCHSVTDARVQDDHRSQIVLSLASGPIAPFRAAELAGRPLPLAERVLVQLNARAHGRAFDRPLLDEDRFCLSCHHAQMREAVAAPGALRCFECHMEPRGELGDVARSRTHAFPGANTTTPALLGHAEVAQRTEQWMTSGRLVRSFADLYHQEGGPQARRYGDDRKSGFFYLEMRARLAEEPRAGAPTTLRIETRNLAMPHAFPASSVDLQEAWLEVQVTDAAGALVFASGGTDAEQRLLPGTHRLGGSLLDAGHAPIERYRVWAAVHEIPGRVVPAGGSTEDELTFDVPATAARHLNVEARWRYRKLGQAFWRWAYSLDAPIPSPVVVRCFAQFPLADPPR